MHDPMTVALEIKYPWRGPSSKLFPEGYRQTFITIWHVDPERRGSDDSCDWFGRSRHLSEKESTLAQAVMDMEYLLDNRPFFPDHPAHLEYQKLKDAVYEWRRRPELRWHPRWHFWHWKFQVHPLQDLKRWAFSRCAGCGRGFSWGYSPTSISWNGTGPRWFRSERHVFHSGCDRSAVKEAII